MQGRLSPQVGDRIQAFPWQYWKDEFLIAEQAGFRLMEWSLDHGDLYDNPLMTSAGRTEIRELQARHGIAICSLTGDCFMQAPFWKEDGDAREELIREFHDVAEACAAQDITTVVVPLVDNGRLESGKQEDGLIEFLGGREGFFRQNGLRIIFESDYGPLKLADFIGRLDVELFGINYDSGNSASLGFDPVEEISAYGHRIMNVHIKDRLPGGTTVPLGEGAADFKGVFSSLAKVGYTGNFILQTARASDSDHAAVLLGYGELTADWIERFGA